MGGGARALCFDASPRTSRGTASRTTEFKEYTEATEEGNRTQTEGSSTAPVRVESAFALRRPEAHCSVASVISVNSVICAAIRRPWKRGAGPEMARQIRGDAVLHSQRSGVSGKIGSASRICAAHHSVFWERLDPRLRTVSNQQRLQRSIATALDGYAYRRRRNCGSFSKWRDGPASLPRATLFALVVAVVPIQAFVSSLQDGRLTTDCN